ncbi:MAG: hypothetical protein ACR2P1_01940 [Pseudomonadales bacterium]
MAIYSEGLSRVQSLGANGQLTVIGPEFDILSRRLLNSQPRSSFASRRRLDVALMLANIAAFEAVSRRSTAGAIMQDRYPGFLMRCIQLIPGGAVGLDHYPEDVASRLARAAATGIHIHCGDQLGRGQLDVHVPLTPYVEQRLSKSVLSYQDLLRRTRRAARQGKRVDIARCGIELVEFARGELGVLCHRIGQACGIAAPSRSELEAELRVAALSRHVAMCASAVILLDHRFRSRRTASSTPEVAKRRTKLWRGLPPVSMSRTTLTNLNPDDPVDLLTRIEVPRFIEARPKPYSVASFQHNPGSVRVAYKSLRNSGAGSGTLWVRGNFKLAGGEQVVEADFEGPGSHSATTWEDWLAVLARPAYYLYPGEIHAEWSHPPLRTAQAAVDVITRIEGT